MSDPPRDPRLSLVPLSPNTHFFPRTLPPPSVRSPSSASYHSSSLGTILYKSPHPPPRPPRPDAPTSVFNPGWNAPFPSSQAPPSRPIRPAKPDEALLFNAPPNYGSPILSYPSPDLSNGSQRESRVWSPISEYENEDEDPEELVDLATIVTAQAQRGQRAAGQQVIARSASQRTLRPEGMRDVRTPSPPPALPPIASTSRLTIDGFEALLHHGDKSVEVEQEPSRENPKGKWRQGQFYEPEGPAGVFSPRAGLGLPSPGVGAREERRARDASVLVGTTSFDMIPTPPPASTYSTDTLKARDGPSPLDSGWRRRRSYGTSSLNNNLTANRASATDTEYSLSSLGVRPMEEAHTRNPTPMGNPVEVVVVPSAGDEGDEGAGGRAGGTRGMPRTTGVRPDKMDFAEVEYFGWLPKLLHLLYPLFFFAHIPATLFLDFNALYILSQLAISPTLPSTINVSSSGVVIRALSVPAIHPSTAYWVAFSMYALCTLLWALVVCLWHDFVQGFLHLWANGGKVHIGRVYSSSPSFSYACMKSYDYFCFLFRVRLAPFKHTSETLEEAERSTPLDGICETFSYLSQNWPTVLLLIPRAGLSLAVLLLYATSVYGDASQPVMTRDTSYFRPTGVLTTYATGVLLANCAWAAWRLLLLLVSFAMLAILTPQTRRQPHTPSFKTRRLSSSKARKQSAWDWKTRRTRRLRKTILACNEGWGPTRAEKIRYDANGRKMESRAGRRHDGGHDI